MLTIPLNDGTSIPWLAFGTGSALFEQDASDAVRMAIENGIIHLDGAQVYGNEDSLGTGIKLSSRPRADLYVVTKLAEVDPGQTVKGALEKSLSKLGVDYVDLFLIHGPTPRNEIKRLWKEMNEVKKLGLSKSIGVSNFEAGDLEVLLDGAESIPAVNQIELHPYVWKASELTVNLSQKHGIVLASFGGLAPIVHVSDGPLDPLLERIRSRIEKAHGKSVTTGQVLTKWLFQKDIVVVTTTSKAYRIKEFIDVEGLPDLTAQEMEEVRIVGSKLHKRVYE